ncbi:carbohydrate ABC transporter permease [Clostridium sp. P21]|uniref:Carbohydrate ABC transporter permease n=1 Tax=Clostridium muellerianum TaxID=2716538 RepID=A0A7Y0EKM1_9CLOT|nr:carbohydrate ABC transporter permease [Clostridium muellerianum]NMM65201.1 carbohydrate ABC transporter permease [Clostridium muellerianum]
MEIAIKEQTKKKKAEIKKLKLKASNIVSHITLIIFSFLMAFPFIWMISSALKTKDEIFKFPPTLIPEVPQWHNFISAFTSAPFDLYIFNSTFTALTIVIVQVVNSAMIAYAITQLEFLGKKILFAIIMATYMLPAAVTYVPGYVVLSKLNLLDTYTGLIISNAVNVFGIFLIRQAFMQINKSLIEAAKMDGATHWQILWRILVPLSKPSFITFGLMSFVSNYNSYLWPSLIIKDPKLNLITMGLRQFFIQQGAYGVKWPEVMAASALTVLPLLILFVVAQKWFMNGIADTGVKG